jgi:hypothetical protein
MWINLFIVNREILVLQRKIAMIEYTQDK